MENVIKSLAKNVLIPLKLAWTASAADREIHKKKVIGSRIKTLVMKKYHEINQIFWRIWFINKNVLAKQLKTNQKNKKVDLLVCY